MRINENKVCNPNCIKINSKTVFKPKCKFFKSKPNWFCIGLFAVVGNALLAPGDAASIILPNKTGNAKVETADKAIKTKPKINLPWYGFMYLKSTKASFKLSFETFTFSTSACCSLLLLNPLFAMCLDYLIV